MLVVFHESEAGYLFFANSAREADEWIRILNSTRYNNNNVMEHIQDPM